MTIKDAADTLFALEYARFPQLSALPWDGKTRRIQVEYGDLIVRKNSDYTASVKPSDCTSSASVCNFEAMGEFYVCCRRVAANIAVESAIHLPTSQHYAEPRWLNVDCATFQSRWDAVVRKIGATPQPPSEHPSISALFGRPSDWSDTENLPDWTPLPRAG